MFESGPHSLGLQLGLALTVDRPHLEREEHRGKKRHAPRQHDKNFVQSGVAAEGLEVERAGNARDRTLEGSEAGLLAGGAGAALRLGRLFG